MTEVLVYVEGRSDVECMHSLFHSLIARKSEEGVTIQFYEVDGGDRKQRLLEFAPQNAVNILRNKPYAQVVVIPDLYPKNKAFPHETVEELRDGILQNFKRTLHRKDLGQDQRYLARFHIFCFKHDLEALVLAAQVSLKNYLGLAALPVSWHIPVEDQNHDRPPKRIVENLFQQHLNRAYRETIDAVEILAHADYRQIATACPQCFQPFVDFLENLSPSRY